MSLDFSLIQQIDAKLPQTQCGLCGHRDGCLPYAQAISQGEDANKCIPGGQPVADALSTLLGRPALTALKSEWPIQQNGRPQRMKAVIREDECIGCTKCISACPVDAIIGSGKQMHTVLSDLCTGCELCIAPCPVDCIDLIADTQILNTEQQQLEQDDLRHRYYAHIQREEKQRFARRGPIVKAEINTGLFAEFSQHIQSVPSIEIQKPIEEKTEIDPQTTIQMARLRTQIKKLEKQLSVREDAKKREQLAQLLQQITATEAMS
ncbi:RnfABCDGE type electron transport complex subunit B [Acinetobacter rathckeae]|uniref:RnfABCDGE type electron transport complex subunit B n=1 Tax=Acinetobacter rathckeae TaxID=2605272 RepID=UPI0018A329D7|nr:RnfABCDGE type electron transport complex subunit B [Acinetobacter rathckeae]MBF7687397.1 RnfABCDGE type electron transport complex subunit B [Acinetobacter rathckeae]MBF7694798.1 RnfABCDGE type electron transport complex subunit B [Acinetobacter rathckeae]